MTIQVDGNDVIAIAQAAAWIGSIVAMLAVGLLVYLMVRPPRHLRQRREAGPEPLEAGELRRLVDRMESRLEVLERLLADQAGRRAPAADHADGILESAREDRDSGRKE